MAQKLSSCSRRENPREVEVVAEGWRKFVEFLKQRGDRVTRSRQVVFEKVMLRHDHFRAEELADELKSGAGKASRGTVYRTLTLMEEAGFVCTVRDGDTHRHYEHTFGHDCHDHMICDVCGAFIEFADARLEKLIADNCGRESFLRRKHRLVIFGTCRNCQKSS
jgi:Fur family ferric uptake transcriptional regulator